MPIRRPTQCWGGIRPREAGPLPPKIPAGGDADRPTTSSEANAPIAGAMVGRSKAPVTTDTRAGRSRLDKQIQRLLFPYLSFGDDEKSEKREEKTNAAHFSQF
ncbi:hypothetical protein OUZ56_018367 [Daphnia magna]|uniref:Uncharacterized protein n=1 Tax=Daphnia magna TaxID=35525 RepID=A0ABQ9Z8Q0_9CRUS|nr:hypothetical protein OUZ56_018367 [Daphnia magna]